MADTIDLTAFACPRCGETTAADHYGPCAACRAELRRSLAATTDDLVVDDSYEPKTNVTPNAVALKD